MVSYVLGFDEDYHMPEVARQVLSSEPEFADVYALKTEIASARQLASTVVESKVSSGVYYSVTRVRTGGLFVPGILGKEFAFNYEANGTSGVDFKPTGEAISAAAVRLGSPVIANGSGWQTTGNVGEMRGAQIRNGVIYHDLSTSFWQDAAAIGVRFDGSLRTYSAFDGHSAQSMVDDGVVHSWSFGPPLVVNGSVFAFWDDPNWGNVSNTVSARQILGQSQFGDVILITVEGATGVSGLTAQGCAALAFAEGCHVALLLDGGGSAQTVAGDPVVLSTDSTPRAVPDFLTLNASVSSFGPGLWRSLTPSTFTGSLQYRRDGRDVMVRGSLTGSLPDVTATTVGQMPLHHYPTYPQIAGVRLGGTYSGTAYVTESGTIGVQQSTGASRNNPLFSVNYRI